jgi:hypothetical protein
MYIHGFFIFLNATDTWTRRLWISKQIDIGCYLHAVGEMWIVKVKNEKLYFEH